MDNHSKIAVIGGDRRQAIVASILAEEGFEVAIYANTATEIGASTRAIDLEGAVTGSAAVLLPLPCSADKVTVFTPLFDKNVYFSELVALLDTQTIIGGMTKVVSDFYDGEIIDYFEDEELQILNAIPTAEGAVAIAMDALPITLHGSNCLVVGFGRVSKALAHALAALGANVTVMARKSCDFAYCELYGYKTTHISTLEDGIRGYDVIFNSVPEKIFTEKVLSKTDRTTLIIDLASRPGGVDFEAAKSLGINVNWALSLPGKVAPVTAGKIIARSVLSSFRGK